MGFRLLVEKGKIPSEVEIFFDFSKLDAFHTAEVLSVLYGLEWYSVLIIDNKKAFFHTFFKQPIIGTDYFDIEPFLGYAGPVLNNNDQSFINQALLVYSDFCAEQNIIAEIVRFNPILKNQLLFENQDILRIFFAKEIVISTTHKDTSKQMAEFGKSRKRDLKIAEKSCFGKISESKIELDEFIKMYHLSLDRVNAANNWYFSNDFFQRIKASSKFNLFEVKDLERVYSASIIIDHPLASYYFLAANSVPPMTGANDLNIYQISQWSAHKDINFLILGGGNSASETDPLLLYKKKFAKESSAFFMGKIIHQQKPFEDLCEEAIRKRPGLKGTSFFLKYRFSKDEK